MEGPFETKWGVLYRFILTASEGSFSAGLSMKREPYCSDVQWRESEARRNIEALALEFVTDLRVSSEGPPLETAVASGLREILEQLPETYQ